jgi:hypothetical protein
LLNNKVLAHTAENAFENQSKVLKKLLLSHQHTAQVIEADNAMEPPHHGYNVR